MENVQFWQSKFKFTETLLWNFADFIKRVIIGQENCSPAGSQDIYKTLLTENYISEDHPYVTSNSIQDDAAK